MRTIIFDFDGTIADSFEILLGVFQEIAKKNTRLTPEKVQQLRGLPVRDVLAELRIRRWQIPRLLVRGRRAITQKMDTIQPISGLPKALNQLNDAGYNLVILSTNSQANINSFLKHHQLDDYFTSVHGGVGVFNKAAALRKLMKKERLKPADCIYVGDEIRDIEAGHRAGVKFISVAWGFNTEQALKTADPMCLIERPAQLAAAVTLLFDNGG